MCIRDRLIYALNFAKSTKRPNLVLVEGNIDVITLHQAGFEMCIRDSPNPAAWLDGQERAFALEGVDDPGETPWGRLLLDDAGRQGAYWRDKIARALELCPCDDNLDANYAPSLSATPVSYTHLPPAPPAGPGAGRFPGN